MVMDRGRRYHWPKLVGFAAMECLVLTLGVIDYSALPHYPALQNHTERATCTCNDQLFGRFYCMRSAGRQQHAAAMMLHCKVMHFENAHCSLDATQDDICAPQHKRGCNLPMLNQQGA